MDCDQWDDLAWSFIIFTERESFECCKSSHLIFSYIEAIQTIYLVTKWELMSIKSFKTREKLLVFLKMNAFDHQWVYWGDGCALEVVKRMIMLACEILSFSMLRFIKFLYDFIRSPLGDNIEHDQKKDDNGHDEGIIALIAIANCHVS